MKKGRHRRFEEARSLKRAVEGGSRRCPECGAGPRTSTPHGARPPDEFEQILGSVNGSEHVDEDDPLTSELTPTRRSEPGAAGRSAVPERGVLDREGYRDTDLVRARSRSMARAQVPGEASVYGLRRPSPRARRWSSFQTGSVAHEGVRRLGAPPVELVAARAPVAGGPTGGPWTSPIRRPRSCPPGAAAAASRRPASARAAAVRRSRAAR